jgi:hypothetical protein
VRRNGAVREVQAPADLAVGEALRGELGDLELLRGQVVAGFWVAAAARFAGCAQLAACSVAP